MSFIQIQLRRGTSTAWASANTVLAEGEIGLELDTKLYKIGDGTSAWSSIGYGGLVGFTGSRGVTGFTGSQGVIGYTGSLGFTGSQGVIGFTGSQGVIGYTGSLGYTGSKGDIGFTGSQGVIGFTGSQGIQGFTGSQGIQGFTGSQGVIGFTGSQGIQGFTGSQGVIGFTGSKGDIGFTGSQGVIGFTGSKGDIGFTGSQGVIGFTGSQGVIGFTGSRGDTGFTGSLGFTGSKGADGNFGGATFDYTFDTGVTAADPGAGKLRFNNLNVSLATAMYIDATNDAATDISAFLNTIDDSTSTIKGHFRVSNRLDASDFALFTISALTNNTGWFTVSCAHVSGSSTSFTNLEDIIITFARTGDIGSTGFTGSVGFVGSKGDLGFTGSQGAGFTGSRGDTGFTGSVGFTGSKGDIGFTGSKGDIGFTGSASTVIGFTGSQGFTGSKGDIGFTGSASTVIGFTGSKGDIGFTGSQGVIGFTGSQGFTGSKGDIGFTGSQGVIGFTGSKGDIGFTGSQGPVAGSNTQLVYNNSGVAAGANVFFTNTNGNLGVGTSAPQQKFVVSDAGAGGVEIIPTGVIQSYNRGTSAYQALYHDASTHVFRIGVTEKMSIAGTGIMSLSANVAMANNYITSPSLQAYKEFVSPVSITTTTATLDLSTTNIFNLSMGNNVTLTFSNPPASGTALSFMLYCKQDATGSRIITWPVTVKWPNNSQPTMSTGANKIDVFNFFTLDGGTTYVGALSLANT